MAYAFNEQELGALMQPIPQQKPSQLSEIFGIKELVGVEVEKFKREFPNYDQIQSKKDKAFALYNWLIPDIPEEARPAFDLPAGHLQQGMREPKIRYGDSYHPGTVLEEGAGNRYAINVLGAAMARELGLESDFIFMQDKITLSSGFSVKTDDGEVYVNPVKRIFAQDPVKHVKVDDRASYMMGLMYTKAENQEYPQALGISDRVLTIQPDFGFIRLPRAEFLEGIGGDEEALTELDNVSDDPNIGFYANTQRSYYQLRSGFKVEALQDMDKAIQQEAGEALLYSNRASIHEGLDDHSSAIADYTKAIELDDKNPRFFLYRGRLRGIQKDNDGAIEDFNRSTELDPENYVGYFFRAQVQFNKKNYPDALEDYKRALDRIDEGNNNSVFDIHLGMGQCRGRLGDIDGAIADFTACIELFPQNPGGYIGRTGAHYDKRDYTVALVDIDKALELDPDNYQSWILKGGAHDRLNQGQHAVEAYGKAIDIKPQSSDPYMLRAKAQEKLGNHDEAAEDRRKAIELQ